MPETIATQEVTALPKLLTVGEYAEYTRRSVRSVYREIERNDVKTVRLSGRVLIPRTELERILSE